MNQEKPSSLLYLGWLIAILLIPVLITQFFLISQLEMLKKDVSLLNVEVELLKNHRIAKRGVGSTVLDCSQCKLSVFSLFFLQLQINVLSVIEFKVLAIQSAE